MRIFVTLAKTKKGKWDCLATPDLKTKAEHIDILKELKALEGDDKYVEGMVMTTSGVVKRYKFKGKKYLAEQKEKEAERMALSEKLRAENDARPLNAGEEKAAAFELQRVAAIKGNQEKLDKSKKANLKKAEKIAKAEKAKAKKLKESAKLTEAEADEKHAAGVAEAAKIKKAKEKNKG